MAENQTPNLLGTVDTAEDLRSPVTRALFDYWSAKRGDRPYPAWSDIHLMDLYKIAPQIVVRDVIDGGREFRCRFSGTGMSAVLGVDGTDQLVAETYRRGTGVVLARYQSVLAAGRPIRAVGHVQAVEKNLPTAFESVFLPLAGTDGTIAHIIVAYDFTYVPAPDEPPVPGGIR